MAVIRPKDEPAATAVSPGDIFLIDGPTYVRGLAASVVPLRDASGNVSLNNVTEGYTTTATAGGTTTLSSASTAQQFFTGALAQTVVLPDVTTLALGMGFLFQNNSTGSVTINSSGGNLVKVLGPGTFADITCVAITGTTAASWSATYFGDIVASGKVLNVSNSLTLAGTDGTTQTFPSASATLARTDAGQTFTGTNVFGVLTATTVNGVTVSGTGSTLAIAAGKTLTQSNTLTYSGTDGSTVAFGAGGTVAYQGGTLGQFAATTSAQLAGVMSDETGSGALVFGTAPTIAGGTVAALTSFGVRSTGAAFDVKLASAEAITATRTLSLVLGNADRTLTVSGAATVTGSNTGDQTITLTGDVTGTGTGSFAATIGATKVTSAMLNSDVYSTAHSWSGVQTFTNPVVGTQTPGNNTTLAASTAFVTAAVSASTVGVSSLNGQTGALTSYYAPQGRLTLVSATPVMMSSNISGTLIYSQYVGSLIPLYDGSNMVPTVFPELSCANTDTTKNPAAIGASKVNDWFVWNDSGTIRLSHGPDWTNDTTRSAGTVLTRVNGILLNSVSIANGPAASRGTYVGTTRSNASSNFSQYLGAAASGGTAGFLGIWNAYNRVTVSAAVNDSGALYTYLGGVRQAGGSAGMQITYVSGLAEDGVVASYTNLLQPASATLGITADIGIGVNSTSTYAARALVQNPTAGVSSAMQPLVPLNLLPVLGVQTIAALEDSSGGSGWNFNALGSAACNSLIATLRM